MLFAKTLEGLILTERFPTKKDRYCQCASRLLPHRVGQIIKELLVEAGYRKGEDFIVWVNPSKEMMLI